MTGGVLSCERVSRRFAGMIAVKDVSLTVRPGEILAVIGPNGAGKTTLFNLLTGQLRANSGQIYLDSRRITGHSVHARVKLGLGRTFQVMRPLPDLTLLENVMIGAFARHPRRREAEAKAWQVIERVGLQRWAASRAGQLPLPARKRLEVARALATEPTVLLLDEVMAGLNPSEIGEAMSLFRDLHDSGLSLLLIEHNLKVVRSLSHHVMVLDHGTLLAEGTPEDVLEHPDVIRAYIGSRR